MWVSLQLLRFLIGNVRNVNCSNTVQKVRHDFFSSCRDPGERNYAIGKNVQSNDD